jgi:hypothetical protein
MTGFGMIGYHGDIRHESVERHGSASQKVAPM